MQVRHIIAAFALTIAAVAPAVYADDTTTETTKPTTTETTAPAPAPEQPATPAPAN